jgi:hypothetical protein
MASGSVRVIARTVGENDTEATVITDTYTLIVAGRCHLASAQIYGNGTHVLTIKDADGSSARETTNVTAGQDALADVERGNLDSAREQLAAMTDDQVEQLDDNLGDLARLVRERSRS